ncbi:MAG: BrnA antitoxin family protein, partial [Nitrososphaerales archaeon]
PPAGKTRITIRIDDDILEWFRKQIEAAGHGSYQASINQVLREYLERQQEPLELILRRVVREELANYTVNPASEQGSDDPS